MDFAHSSKNSNLWIFHIISAIIVKVNMLNTTVQLEYF